MSGGQLIRSDPPLSDRLCLLALVALVPIRAVISETHSLETPELMRLLDAVTGPLPGTTLVLSGVIFAIALLSKCLRLARGSADVATGAEIGGLVLAIAGIISISAAGQKRVAITGVVDFLSLLVFFITLRQLLVRPWQLRLVICTVLATGMTVAIKCIYQVWVEFPETARFWSEFAQSQNAGPLDPGHRHDLEQRIHSQSATGFFTHANITATYLAVIIMTAAALVRCRLAGSRSRGARLATCLVPGVVGVTALAALWLTQSKGAAAALLFGLFLWACAEAYKEWLWAHRRGALVAFWGLALAAPIAVASFGLLRGGLPTLSMLYRWQYWRGAVAMIRTEGWRGVGVDNFGDLFTRFKPVECPEEVQDPHSWIVRAAAEWGILGLLGLVLIWIGISRRLAISPSPSRPLSPSLTSASSMPAWLFSVALVLCAADLTIHADSFDFPERASAVITAIAAIAVAWMASFTLLVAESNDVTRISEDALANLRPGLIVAGLVFLLHASIDLALFSSGAATTFFAILALASALNGAQAASTLPRKRGAAAGLALLSILVLAAYGWFVARPPLVAGARLSQARNATAAARPRLTGFDDLAGSGVLQLYEQAIEADPLDATPVDELLDILLHVPLVRTQEHCDAALRWTEVLRRRDPHSAAADDHAATAWRMRFDLTHDPADLHHAVEALRRNVERYPTSPDRRLELGRGLARLAAVTGSAEFCTEAAGQLNAAIDLDARRIYISKPNRLKDEEIAAIRREIAALTQ